MEMGRGESGCPGNIDRAIRRRSAVIPAMRCRNFTGSENRIAAGIANAGLRGLVMDAITAGRKGI
ncbi:hypothetical protein DM450_10290 [Sphingomonas sp. IC081]|nr:hypothetical protein DM450_10290 [Sphingomonas sp. IC081]